MSEPDGVPRRHGGLWEQVATIAVAVAVALLFRALVLEPYRIPSASMLPNLLVGDHLFVNKFAYGAALPFTDLRLPALRSPERGEIVVFTVARDGVSTHPADRRPDLPREEFVKRIVAVPGDRVEFRDDRLLVNGEPVPARRLDWTFAEGDRAHVVRELRADERRYRVLDDPEVVAPPGKPQVVEEDRYYVMGDNRDHSEDSRYWGTVHRDQIKGPAFLIYWSWKYDGGWLELLNPLTWWRTEKRWERVGARL